MRTYRQYSYAPWEDPQALAPESPAMPRACLLAASLIAITQSAPLQPQARLRADDVHNISTELGLDLDQIIEDQSNNLLDEYVAPALANLPASHNMTDTPLYKDGQLGPFTVGGCSVDAPYSVGLQAINGLNKTTISKATYSNRVLSIPLSAQIEPVWSARMILKADGCKLANLVDDYEVSSTLRNKLSASATAEATLEVKFSFQGLCVRVKTIKAKDLDLSIHSKFTSDFPKFNEEIQEAIDSADELADGLLDKLEPKILEIVNNVVLSNVTGTLNDHIPEILKEGC